MSNSFLETVRDYLPGYLHSRAASDRALIAQFVAPDAGPRTKAREALVRELAGDVSKKDTAWKSAARLVQRWVTGAKERRGATGFAKGERGKSVRERVERALRTRYTPVVVHYDGELRFSQKWYPNGFTAPQGRDPISLRELQDILKLGADVENEDGLEEAEAICRKVLVGFWMGDPSDDTYLKKEYGVDLPYREDVEEWRNEQFTIEQVEEPAASQSAAA